MPSAPASFRVLSAVILKELKQYRRVPVRLAVIVAAPFLFPLLITGMGSFVGGENAANHVAARIGASDTYVYHTLGAAIWIVSWMIMEDLGLSLKGEMVRGTLEQNFMSPARRIFLLAGPALATMLIAMGALVVIITTSLAFSQLLELFKLVQALVIITLGLGPMLGLGFAFAGLVVRFKEPFAFTPVINLLLSILMGVYYPVTILPSWVQTLSRAIPQTYVIEDLRLIILKDRTLVDLYDHFGILLGMSLIYPLLGYYFFKVFEREAKTGGNLSKY